MRKIEPDTAHTTCMNCILNIIHCQVAQLLLIQPVHWNGEMRAACNRPGQMHPSHMQQMRAVNHNHKA